MSWGVFASLLFYGRECVGSVLLLFEMFGRICQWNHLVLGRFFFFPRRFWTMSSISLIVTGYSGYLFHLGWVLVVHDFRGIGPFHLSCQIYVCVVCGFLIIPLMSTGSVMIFSFTLDIGNLCFFLYFCQSSEKFIFFWNFSKNHLQSNIPKIFSVQHAINVKKLSVTDSTFFFHSMKSGVYFILTAHFNHMWGVACAHVWLVVL